MLPVVSVEKVGTGEGGFFHIYFYFMKYRVVLHNNS